MKDLRLQVKKQRRRAEMTEGQRKIRRMILRMTNGQRTLGRA